MNEDVELHEFVKIKLKKEGCSHKHHIKLEMKVGEEYSENIKKYSDCYRLIDRENDKYREIIREHDTGKLIHSCEEPLSMHINHGTAKSKK
jgi:hypothetical protein